VISRAEIKKKEMARQKQKKKIDVTPPTVTEVALSDFQSPP
jgi:hypothetical protein